MSVPKRLIDVSHTVEDGMVTYKGLPAPVICDWRSREESRAIYDGAEFQIGRIDMVGTPPSCLPARSRSSNISVGSTPRPPEAADSRPCR